jgi:hypothetical protein
MRLSDIIEAMQCCAASVEDSLAIEKAMLPVVQYLFDAGQRSDIIAGDIYKEIWDKEKVSKIKYNTV